MLKVGDRVRIILSDGAIVEDTLSEYARILHTTSEIVRVDVRRADGRLYPDVVSVTVLP